jgi:hypothetical protein
MKFKQSRTYVSAGHFISVQCTVPAIVLVMTDDELTGYQYGRGAHYAGGFFTHYPAWIEINRSGYWNVVIEPVSEHPEDAQFSITLVGLEAAFRATAPIDRLLQNNPS